MGLSTLLSPLLLGFIATSFQIFLLREFCIHFYGNEMTFGFVLASWLLWGGVGSVSASRFPFNLKKLPQAYYTLILLFPLCLIGLRFSRFALRLLPGEITGMIPMLIFSLFISLFISFPLGLLFVFNVHFNKGNVSRVYLLESLGASFSGLTVYFLLVPYFSNWQGTAIIGIIISLLIFLSFGQKRLKFVFVFIFIFLIAFSLFDIPSQKIYWKPFPLQKSKDSPYGKLQVIKNREQVSLYNNSLLVYSYPNLAVSEESIHFAFLQIPEAKRALLIGGGAGGSLAEALKYPQVEVDYVELDPEIIRLSLEFLPEEEKRILKNRRVHLFLQDGRAFLHKVQKTYDLIILNLPEPATAQINRFYTKEFFLKVKEKLAEKGVFSFLVPSAENYISPELQQFLATLHFTLYKAFDMVEVVPGDTNVFLASSSSLSIDFDELSQKIETLHLRTSYIRPQLLQSRLHPLRINLLKEKMEKGRKKINLDFVPISYFYNSVLWNTQFKGLEAKILNSFSELSSFWLLDFPLLLFLLILFFFWLRRKKSAFFLVPLAVMGFTTIISEIIVIICFQTLYGYVYGQMALLLTTFMAGLFLGSLWSSKRKKKDFFRILLIQSLFILLIFFLYLSLKTHASEIFLFLFLLILGFLGGDLFIVSNHLYLKEKTNYGLGYGLDLGGSFLGALAASSLLIPLVGLPQLLKYLFLLNSFCFLFLIGKPKQ